ncbi:CRISPR-associated protein [Sulfobacillus thermotolerans]|uniref:CRISPR-associated protein n=1 Tax=Sulfobacillus thermotolerans TaxID=338644 RepID=A0ABM6RSN9_9FIRM|nr:CRISPR-associated protein [Sulfobacillus thermotolerans]
MNVLIITVGGSPDPILSAWRSLQPEFTIFVCSEDNTTTGEAGSYRYVTDKNPRAITISKTLSLAPESYTIQLVPTDDLVTAYHLIKQTLQQFHVTYPNATLHANYTGGTKSMSAALVLAASEAEYVKVSVMAGARNDLIKVSAGTESLQPVEMSEVQTQRDASLMLSHWQSYSYESAAQGLDNLLNGLANMHLRSELTYARAISRAFQLWDRFQHQDALATLAIFEKKMTSALRAYYIDLKELTHSNKPLIGRFLQLWDLWLNAQRRAAQQRYDDAIGRCYRLIEASGQWILGMYDIDSSKVEMETIAPYAEDLGINMGKEGPYKLALMQIWTLVPHIHKGPLSMVIKEQKGAMQNLLSIRNHSLCAHGFSPISQDEWNQWNTWLEQVFIPALKDEAASYVKRFPKQLPRNYSELT